MPNPWNNDVIVDRFVWNILFKHANDRIDLRSQWLRNIMNLNKRWRRSFFHCFSTCKYLFCYRSTDLLTWGKIEFSFYFHDPEDPQAHENAFVFNGPFVVPKNLIIAIIKEARLTSIRIRTTLWGDQLEEHLFAPLKQEKNLKMIHERGSPSTVVNVSHCDTPTFTISSLDVVEEILHLVKERIRLLLRIGSKHLRLRIRHRTLLNEFMKNKFTKNETYELEHLDVVLYDTYSHEPVKSFAQPYQTTGLVNFINFIGTICPYLQLLSVNLRACVNGSEIDEDLSDIASYLADTVQLLVDNVISAVSSPHFVLQLGFTIRVPKADFQWLNVNALSNIGEPTNWPPPLILPTSVSLGSARIISSPGSADANRRRNFLYVILFCDN